MAVAQAAGTLCAGERQGHMPLSGDTGCALHSSGKPCPRGAQEPCKFATSPEGKAASVPPFQRAVSVGEEKEEEQKEEEAGAHEEQRGLQLSLGSHPAGRTVPGCWCCSRWQHAPALDRMPRSCLPAP